MNFWWKKKINKEWFSIKITTDDLETKLDAIIYKCLTKDGKNWKRISEGEIYGKGYVNKNQEQHLIEEKKTTIDTPLKVSLENLIPRMRVPTPISLRILSLLFSHPFQNDFQRPWSSDVRL